jgi:hypothetical protein
VGDTKTADGIGLSLVLQFRIASGLLGFCLIFGHFEYRAHHWVDDVLEVNRLTGIDMDFLTICSEIRRDIKRVSQDMITGRKLKLHVTTVFEFVSRAIIYVPEP